MKLAAATTTAAAATALLLISPPIDGVDGHRHARQAAAASCFQFVRSFDEGGEAEAAAAEVAAPSRGGPSYSSARRRRRRNLSPSSSSPWRRRSLVSVAAAPHSHGLDRRRKFTTARSSSLSSPLWRTTELWAVLPPAKDGDDDDGSSSSGPSSGGRKRDVVLTMMRRFVVRFALLRKTIRNAVGAVVKRAKGKTRAVANAVNLLLLAFLIKDAVLPSFTTTGGAGAASSTSSAPSAVVATSVAAAAATTAPVEVPYSRFLDYCEGRDTNVDTFFGRSRLGGGAAVHVDTVTIDTDSGRLNYRILRGETRGQRRALKKILKRGGGAVALDADVIPHTDAFTHLIDGAATSDLLRHLRDNDIEFKASEASSTTEEGGVGKRGKKSSDDDDGGNTFLPTLAFGALAYRFYQTNGGPSLSSGRGGGPGIFANKRKKKSSSSATSSSSPSATTFDDIEGIDDAKDDVMELVDTLRNPDKYRLVGARPPTGLLLVGPPGTGKTTLARATASMADVPMLYCSGSDFVEKYAGTGAARVRSLFAKADKVKGPCIIFIDEIDALGKKRRGGGDGGGGSGSADEAEQTLNALLTCMDGLDTGVSSSSGDGDDKDGSKKVICVLGATNRKDVLDPALVRPGRFDRIIKVDLPDEAGRERILRVHASKLKGFVEAREGGVADDDDDVTTRRTRPEGEDRRSSGGGKAVDLSAIAAITDGLSGAELESIVNEAALRAVRRVGEQLDRGVDVDDVDNSVYPHDFEVSVDKFFESRDRKMMKDGEGQRMGFAVD